MENSDKILRRLDEIEKLLKQHLGPLPIAEPLHEEVKKIKSKVEQLERKANGY